MTNARTALEKANGFVNELQNKCGLATLRAVAAESRESETKSELKKVSDTASLLEAEVARLNAKLEAEVNKSADLGIYQFSSAPQSCGRGRQDRINLTMRRSPRVNQEVLPRATFLG